MKASCIHANVNFSTKISCMEIQNMGLSALNNILLYELRGFLRINKILVQ